MTPVEMCGKVQGNQKQCEAHGNIGCVKKNKNPRLVRKRKEASGDYAGWWDGMVGVCLIKYNTDGVDAVVLLLCTQHK